MIKNLLFIAGLLSFKIAIAQSPAIRTSVDKRSILIGEQLKYKVEVNVPSNDYTLSWLNFPDSMNQFEVVSRGKIDTTNSNNGIINYRQVITLTSFDSGLQIIPPLPVSFEEIDKDVSQNLFTDSVIVSVSYSPLDSTKTFHDIKSIIEVEDKWPLWVWFAIACGVILLIALIYFLIKYLRKEKKPEPIFHSKFSPLEEAMQQLKELEKKKLLVKGEAKQYHTTLIEIFKRYASRKLGSNMLNLTSPEILMQMNQTLLSKESTSLLANSLVMGDAVKFAKYLPANSDSEQSFLVIKNLIDQLDKLNVEK